MKQNPHRGAGLLAVPVLVTLLAMLLAPSNPPRRPDRGGARAAMAKMPTTLRDVGSQAGAARQGCDGEVCPGQYLVKVRGEVTPQLINVLRTLTSQALTEKGLSDEVSAEEIGNSGVILIKTSRTEVNDLLDAFNSKRNDADALAHLFGPAEFDPVIEADSVPSDPLFPNQWGLYNTGQMYLPCAFQEISLQGSPAAQVSAVPAWDCATGDRKNVVAVLDTGIDYTHPDLVNNIWTARKPYTIRHGGQDITCPPGSHGFNILGNPGDQKSLCCPLDDQDHGTHVAGIIGAEGSIPPAVGVGVAGVNWAASIMAVKFLDDRKKGCVSGAIEAIEVVIAIKEQLGKDANVRVLNNSYGFSDTNLCPSTILQSAVERANSKNLLFVAGAGNQYSTKPFYPAAYPVPNVIAVAATNHLDNLWCESNYGNWVHLGAPGSVIYSTTRGNRYTYKDGTSMATAFVSGAAALVLSRCDSLDALGLKNQILDNVDLIPALDTITVSSGRLNVNKALRGCGRCGPRLDGR